MPIDERQPPVAARPGGITTGEMSDDDLEAVVGGGFEPPTKDGMGRIGHLPPDCELPNPLAR